MKKNYMMLFLLVVIIVTSCQNFNFQSSFFSNFSNTTSNISVTTDLSSSAKDSLTSSYSSNINNYQKDEEGFYILETDYFINKSIEDNKSVSKIRFSDKLHDLYKYSQLRMFIGDKQVPLINCKTNMSQIWNGEAPSRMNNSVAIIELEGKVEIKLQANFAILGECTIRPLSANIKPTIDENRRVVSLTISSSGQYTIEFRGRRTLHLFVNNYKEFDDYKISSNLIYFGEGIHNKSNSSYINSNNIIDLNSNTTVFIDSGAIVQAAFCASNKSNIKIIGSGIVDGSIFERSVQNGTTRIPYDFNYCNNIVFKGITTLDPAGWCYNIYFCNDIRFDNIKIISSRSNGDGVSIQSCQNVVCENSFIRSWDDSLVVKNYPKWNDRSQHGTTRNIKFENCILWTDLAQSMEIGYETVGEVMEDITFNNITVLHNYHKAIISIHNANNANIKNVKFTNITIEDLATGKGDGKNIFIDIANIFSNTWSTNHTITSLGKINGVLIENVKIIDGNDDPLINISGTIDFRSEYYNSYHYIENVTIKDVLLKNQILDESYENLNIHLANNVKFENSNNEITGASIKYIDSSSYGRKYSIEII